MAAKQNSVILGVTSFGVRTTSSSAEIDKCQEFLYGKEVFTEKELQKIDKMKKFYEKQAKMKAKEQGEGEKEAKKEKEVKVKKEPAVEYVYVAPAPGEKKNTSGVFPPVYIPRETEDAWNAWWIKQGFFKPEYNAGHKHISLVNTASLSSVPSAPTDRFTIVFPPPNVTGSLHLGHALTNAIEDSLVRWNRMNGKVTLWLPGSDHAGIATQSVVEKKLWKDEKKTRTDLGREAFVQRVWQWKEVNGSRIYDQMKALGGSFDWSREAFTLNDKCSKAVQTAFIRFHEEGLIKREEKLVHWSCKLSSAISEIEVDKKEITGRTGFSVPGYERKVDFGVITSFAYKIEGSDEEIVVATTRPETMLGDTAVAVHPTDVRYKHLHGKFAIHPFLERKLLIVADDFVDPAFGTGAVKITPAHDYNDFDCGKRHKLPFITVIEKNGLISPGCAHFTGMKRFDARDKVVESLKELGLYRGEASNAMVVPVCSRSGDIIEPLLVPQWFCDCSSMAADAAQAVRSGALRIVPSSHEKTWFNWLDNIRDWCISRQLWWGHRIPAYFVTVNDPAVPPGSDKDDRYWVSAASEAEARTKAASRFKVAESKISLRQDEDVLDTWFSSGIFPISVFGWPENTPDFNDFFPGHLLETGHDILFFWVARMVMMCKKLTGKLPFTTVYLHGIIRDAHGRKMSKSLGNVIDPLDVKSGITLEEMSKKLEQGNLDQRELEKAREGQKKDFPQGIPECGVDAMRFGLCAFSVLGRDINLDVKRIHAYKNFCNKIWQGCKLVKMSLGDDYVPSPVVSLTGKEKRVDRWILSRLAECVKSVNEAFANYDFPRVTMAIQSFFVGDFCDYYLEFVKPVFKGSDDGAIASARNALYTCIDVSLRLMSPIMPFITEELFQRFPRRAKDSPPSICVAQYPSIAMASAWVDPSLDAEIQSVQGIINALRSLRAEYLQSRNLSDVYIKTKTAHAEGVAKTHLDAVKALVKATSLSVLSSTQVVSGGCAFALVGDFEVHISLQGLNFEEEIGKARKKLEEQQVAAAKCEKDMKSENFSKVPEEVQKEMADKHAEYLGRIESIKTAIATYEKLISSSKK